MLLCCLHLSSAEVLYAEVLCSTLLQAEVLCADGLRCSLRQANTLCRVVLRTDVLRDVRLPDAVAPALLCAGHPLAQSPMVHPPAHLLCALAGLL